MVMEELVVAAVKGEHDWGRGKSQGHRLGLETCKITNEQQHDIEGKIQIGRKVFVCKKYLNAWENLSHNTY